MAAPSPSRRQPKKVRPPPKSAQSPEALQETLDRLSWAIEEIQKKNASKLSFEEHYRYAYNICLHRQPDMLYKAVIDLVNAHLKNEAKDRVEPAFPTSSFLSNTGGTASASASATATTSTSSVTASRGLANGAGVEYGQGRIAQAMEGETFLAAMKGTWEDHKTTMGKLRDVLKYMDKVHTDPKGLAPTYTLGLHLFLTTLLRHPTIAIQTNLLSVTLALIRIERDGETVNQGLLKTMTSMLCELREVSNEGRQAEGESIYKSWWEDEFLKNTRTYYTQEAEMNLERLSAPEFLLSVEKRLQEEEKRVDTYLHPTTHTLLFSLLDNVLIENNVQSLIDHPVLGLSALLTQDRTQDLGRMYRLLGRVGSGHPSLMRGIKVWLVEQGAKIVETASSGAAASASSKAATGEVPTRDNNEEQENIPPPGVDGSAKKDKGKGRAVDASAVLASSSTATASKQPAAGTVAAGNNVAIEWVNAVLALKDKMDNLWSEAFEKDRAVQNAINDAFETFVNQVRKSPEYISIFLDENLKKGLKGKNESEVDSILDKTITVFRFITDKDVFEDYYKRHLARRLYFGRSVSDDAERTMLQKLKLECGASFVAKLEGMLKDVGFSEELNGGYKKYLEGLGSERPSTELSVQVCTSSFWPTTPDVPCILPSELSKITKSFERYFNTRFTGRKLSWHAEHGSVDVKVRFGGTKGGTKELNLATHGFVVLAMFEGLANGEELGYQDIAAGTGLPEAHLKRTLQSLACAKYKILRKEPFSRTVLPSDKFSFNHTFTDKLVRLKIQTIANRVETVQESQETDTRLEAERSQVLEAAIVRVMKSRKTLSHSELVNETVGQLKRRFNPKPLSIKLAIDKLIEKEYLERDEKDKKVLRYLA